MLDPDQVEALRNAHAAAAARRAREFLLSVLAGPQGREWLWSQLTTCDIFGNVFSPDAAVTAFNLGRQDWGKRMFAEILAAAPQAYFQMALEAKEREDALRRELDRDDANDRGEDLDRVYDPRHFGEGRSSPSQGGDLHNEV